MGLTAKDTATGGAGTAVKLASHFHMAQHLVQAGEDGLDHANLCREAQAWHGYLTWLGNARLSRRWVCVIFHLVMEALDVEKHPEYEIYCGLVVKEDRLVLGRFVLTCSKP